MAETDKPDPEDPLPLDSGNHPSQPEADAEPDIWVADDAEPAADSQTTDDQPADDEEYRLADEAAPSGKSASEAADWYYIVGDQPRQGPVSLGDLQRLVAAGQLGRKDKVWRSGLAEWSEVANVPELFDEAAPPPPPSEPEPAPVEDRAPDPMEGLRSIERMLTEPVVLRIVGWVCGAAGATAAMVSIPLLLFGRSWFIGATVLLMAFLVLHALARLIEDGRK